MPGLMHAQTVSAGQAESMQAMDENKEVAETPTPFKTELTGPTVKPKKEKKKRKKKTATAVNDSNEIDEDNVPKKKSKSNKSLKYNPR